jgi:hypothetical protein
MQSVSYVQVNYVHSSKLFDHVALVRMVFTWFCSQIRSQHSNQRVQSRGFSAHRPDRFWSIARNGVVPPMSFTSDVSVSS